MRGGFCANLLKVKTMGSHLISIINAPSWFSLSCFACLILIFVIFNSIKNKELSSIDGRMFFILTCVTFVNLILNVLSTIPWDGGQTSAIWLKIANFLNYTFTTSLFVIYSFYVYSRIGEDKERAKVLIFCLIGVFLVDMGLCFSSIWDGFYFGFGENGYFRGSLFFVHVILLVLMSLLVEIIVFSFRKRLDRKSLKYYASFPLLPFLGMVFQIIFYGIPWALLFVTIAILIVSYYRRSRSTEVDYLTDTFNRRKLDTALYGKIKEAKNGRSFSLILLDLDYFKAINDKLGHTVGDLALEDAAKILKKSLKTKEDFVARYGGDEFCVVTEVTDVPSLESFAKAIKDNVAEFNRVSKRPYQLGFSIGYSSYDPSSNMALHDFYDLVDKKMYIDKTGKPKTE